METRKDRTLLVMPAFNEEKNIQIVVSEIITALPDFDLLVVNDGSTDETENLANEMGIDMITLPFNLGVGAAMRAGFKFAKVHGYQYLIQIDADGQHIPEEVFKIKNQLTNADVVIGSRFVNGFDDFQVTFIRRMAMVTLGKSISRIVGTKLTDVSSGFRGSNKKAIDLFSERYPPEYLGDTIESVIIAHKHGLKIKEVPTQMRQRLHGESSQSTFQALIYTLRAFLVIGLSLLQTKK